MKKGIASGLAILLIAAGTLQAWVSQAAMPLPDIPGDTSHVTAVANDGLLDIFFIGKRGSQLEPCGCQMKQRGGMQYEGSVYNQHSGRPSIRVDAGEFTRGGLDRSPLTSLQTAYVLRAMQELHEDAVNVSLNDLQFQKDFYDNLKDPKTGFPGVLDALISVNTFDLKKPDQLVFPAERIVERKLADGRTIKIGFTGATTLSWTQAVKEDKLEYGDFLVKDPKALLAAEVDALRPKVDLLVVLYASLDRNEAATMADSMPKADFFVTTASAADPASLVVQSGPVYIFHCPVQQGKEVGIISVKPAAAPQEKRWQPAGDFQNLYVSLDLPIDPKIASLIESFKDDTAKIVVTAPTVRDQIYAGAEACMNCHAAVYNSWTQTKHSHALNALINKRMQFNPECVKCHVTGFQSKSDSKVNGFYTVSDQQSLDRANVQCEVCHGPAEEHVKREQQLMAHVERWKTPAEFAEIVKQAKLAMPPAKVESNKCMECHQGDNDPDFQNKPAETYAHKVTLINHSDVPQADRRAPPVPTPFPPDSVGAKAASSPAPPAGTPLASPLAGTPAPTLTPPLVNGTAAGVQAPATGPTPIVTTPNP